MSQLWYSAAFFARVHWQKYFGHLDFKDSCSFSPAINTFSSYVRYPMSKWAGWSEQVDSGTWYCGAVSQLWAVLFVSFGETAFQSSWERDGEMFLLAIPWKPVLGKPEVPAGLVCTPAPWVSRCACCVSDSRWLSLGPLIFCSVCC